LIDLITLQAGLERIDEIVAEYLKNGETLEQEGETRIRGGATRKKQFR
jgi:hypothetical protein